MEKAGDLCIGDELEIPTGFTNFGREDESFYCRMIGKEIDINSGEARGIFSANNKIVLDGRNEVQPYFNVNDEIIITRNCERERYRLCIAGVLFDSTGLDSNGRIKIK